MPADTENWDTGLESIRHAYPSLFRLADIVVSQLPGLEKSLAKSIKARPPALLQTSDRLATAILELSATETSEHAADYGWLCDRIREEELFFARNDRYRYSTFAETNQNVYSDRAFMRRYMNGLLYSQALWYMHASSLHFFSQRLGARLRGGGKVLEIGSGHGLLLFLALKHLGMSEAVAWDLSEVSLDQTRHALGKLGALDRARFVLRDMNKNETEGERFDLVILSHLLEHLENPVEALKAVRGALQKTGLIFVNVPLNAPMPDHLILLRTPGEAEQILKDAGFQIVESSTHTAEAMPLAKALRLRTAVTCSIIAELA